MITQRAGKVFLSVITVLLTLAYVEAAQAATWHFKDTMVTEVNLDTGSPLPRPPFSITGVFVEQGGHIPHWDILVGGVEFTSAPPIFRACGGEPCPASATVLSPTSIRFASVFAPSASGNQHLVLELAAPLDSSAETIGLVPGSFDVQTQGRGSLLRYFGDAVSIGLVAGSITTIPEPQTITAMALGVALLICLHMIVRRRLRGARERRVTK